MIAPLKEAETDTEINTNTFLTVHDNFGEVPKTTLRSDYRLLQIKQRTITPTN